MLFYEEEISQCIIIYIRLGAQGLNCLFLKQIEDISLSLDT